jgi:hypothetical protein
MKKNQYTKEGFREGYWEWRYYNNNIWLKGNYKNGLRTGYWEECDFNGKVIGIEYYYI